MHAVLIVAFLVLVCFGIAGLVLFGMSDVEDGDWWE